MMVFESFSKASRELEDAGMSCWLVCMTVRKLPVLDTFRNFLAMPTIEGKRSLLAIRSLAFAA